MQTTRRKILSYLEAQPPASARTISHDLHMTVANIRHHLRRLEEDDLVEVVNKRPVEGRGRPTLIYGLTHRATMDDLRQLTTALWKELLNELPDDEARQLVQKLARRLIPTERGQGGSLTQRLYSAVRQLQGLDFNARWEAHAESPLVILEHCPFSALRLELPEICSLDTEIITILVGQPVEQLAARNQLRRGQSQCVFRILSE